MNLSFTINSSCTEESLYVWMAHNSQRQEVSDLTNIEIFFAMQLSDYVAYSHHPSAETNMDTQQNHPLLQ